MGVYVSVCLSVCPSVPASADVHVIMYAVILPPQLSQLIVNAGGVAAVVDYIGETRGNVRLPGVMMLGYVSAHSENLAMAVIVSKVKVFIHGF